MNFTLEQIKEYVGSKPAWAERAVIALFACQTADEQDTGTTRWDNSMGFNGVDAEILSSFARQLQAGRHLTDKQLKIAYKKLPKYAGQLFRIAQGKEDKPNVS